MRLQFPNPDDVERKTRVAVSINAWKPKPVGKKPVPARLAIGDEIVMPRFGGQPEPLAGPPEPPAEQPRTLV